MNPLYPKLVFIANGALFLLIAYMSVSEIRFVRRFDVPTTWQQASGITFLGGELLLVVCSLLANITAYLIDRRS
jgi:uncharacterized membrane protein